MRNIKEIQLYLMILKNVIDEVTRKRIKILTVKYKTHYDEQ